MFCQSCGAQNATDARFCNMCGAALEAPTAGSTLRSATGRAPSAPPSGQLPGPYDPGASSVSLASIGVQSSGRTWAFIGGLVVVLLLLGGVGGWLTTRGSAAPEVVVPPDAIAAPMEIGTPTSVDEGPPAGESPPRGVEPPSGVAQRVANARRAAAGAPGASAATGGTTGGMTGAGRAPRADEPSGGATTETGTGTEAGTGTEGGTGAVANAEPSNTVPLDEPVEEQDLMFDLYLTQVRRFIRTYYATRAQSCFDHASRNNEGIRGTVVITFTIAADGLVPAARATRNTTGDDALGGCLVSQVRAWDLPDPPGGELELAMPFSR